MIWDNFINKNSVGEKYYADCQLVTTINAYYFLTKNIIKQDSKEYREFAELAGCCYGSCICIQKVWEKLNIVVDKRFCLNQLHDYLRKNQFIEAHVWHKKYGFHSIGIINYLEDKELVRVTNFSYETKNGWIELNKLKNFIVMNPNKDEPRHEFRTFKITL